MTLAEEYARQHRWRGWARVYERLPLEPGQRVVDLGCAIGDQAADLAARGVRVIGVDANVELLGVARGRRIPGTTFVEADLRTWRNASLAADGLWCSFAAAYFIDFAAVLTEWIAALRPGAWVALVEVDDLFGHEPLSAATRDALARYCDDGYRERRYDFRMGRRLASCARGAGLEVCVEMELADPELAFAGPASAEIITAWDLRLSRMSLLRQFLGDRWEATRQELLACLARADHRSTARVVVVLATTSGVTE
jgi:SAM-dependent methyltransferase